MVSNVSMQFAIEAQSGPARAGRMSLAHGQVETPVFMPVGTSASVKAVPQETLEQLRVGIILANTYHLYLRPGHELIQRLGGLHRFMSWPHPILTDSGGFQVFSLQSLRRVTEEGVRFRSHLDGSSHFLSPERSIEIQAALGADIIMAFDECTEYPADRARVRQSLDLTYAWARRSVEAAKNISARQSLFGIVQGGMYPDLRRESAERLVDLDLAGYAIGGLSVGEPRSLRRDIIEATIAWLPPDRPRYVMGVGYPEEIVEYAALGVDMMDCVLPTRAARHGLLFTSEGRVNIRASRYAEDAGPLDRACRCPVCVRYSRAYLRHLTASREPLAAVLGTIHNIAFYLDTMRSVRDAIWKGSLPDLVARVRAREVDGGNQAASEPGLNRLQGRGMS